MPYWTDRATAALARELNSLRKDIAVLILLARSVLEDFVMRHINTTLYVIMSSIIPTPLIPNYMGKLEVIFCVRGVISPLLANLFLHYAFDEWMRRTYPQNPFERYADDAVVHCKTESEAEELRNAIAKRLAQCKLELHPEKTKIVYCKDDDRRGNYLNEKFDFLGFTFRARKSKNRWGKYFINFSPAVSDKAAKTMRRTIKRWRLHLRSDKALDDLSRMFNPVLHGWINYYGSYYKSALYPILRHLNRFLTRWAMRKFKKLRGHQRQATHWLGRIARQGPNLFAHWQLGVRPAAG
jgi:RNA-directed DNA polymerase